MITPGHPACDFREHGAAEPDENGKVSLTEEKLEYFKSNHVAFGSHPHDNDAAETVCNAKLLVRGETETILTNNEHSCRGMSTAEMSGRGPVRSDIGNYDVSSDVVDPAVVA